MRRWLGFVSPELALEGEPEVHVNQAARCMGPDGWGSGDSCRVGDWDPASYSGVRPGTVLTPGGYQVDPLRDRAALYSSSGYMRPGYDTFRAQILAGSGSR